MGDGLKHSKIPIRQPLNVFFNNESTFDVHSEKINLISTGSIETSNMIVKYDNVAYEWNSNVYSSIFDQNEFSNIGNDVSLKSIPYSKLLDKADTSIDILTPIDEPVVDVSSIEIPRIPSSTSGDVEATWNDGIYIIKTKTSDAIWTNDYTNHGPWRLFNNIYKSPEATDDTFHTTKLFAKSGSSSTNGIYSGSTAFKDNLGVVVYIDLGRPFILRKMEIAPRQIWANLASPKRFKIYASNDSACWSDNDHSSWIEIHNQTTDLTWKEEEYTEFGNFSETTSLYQYFTMVVMNTVAEWGHFCISEWNIYGKEQITSVEIDSDYKYLSFPHSGGSETQTPYSVNFPEDTECDILIVGGSKYRYSTGQSLQGDYNISVGNSSSIIKTDNTETYDYNLTNLPIINSITESSITYNSPVVIIRYKLTSGSTFNGKTPGILKYLPTTTNPPSNTGSWAIQEADTVTFKSDFVYTLQKLTSTQNGNNYTTDFLFDPDTKFTPKENWGKNYTYNICASVNSTDTADNKKYCFVFVYFNNKSGTPTFNHNIISSNDDSDWTISDYTDTTNKKYVKITVQTTNPIDYLNIKI